MTEQLGRLSGWLRSLLVEDSGDLVCEEMVCVSVAVPAVCFETKRFDVWWTTKESCPRKDVMFFLFCCYRVAMAP